MTTAELLSFMREHSLAVQASVSAVGTPQAAVVGIVVTDDFEVFFDTVDTSRKVGNLRSNRKIAFVIGGMTDGDERTVQYEGISEEPSGVELGRLKQLYFESFPDGRERQTWPGIAYIRTRPMWIRFSDFNHDPPEIVEIDHAELKGST
ncbi:MAG: pyridoxamine 5'-phosphate oxidase family protein [Actinomycetota bacterium]|nr:pyridoxamine 5'-phosphate oxidase family protein [Actinomycetota bacterium]